MFGIILLYVIKAPNHDYILLLIQPVYDCSNHWDCSILHVSTVSEVSICKKLLTLSWQSLQDAAAGCGQISDGLPLLLSWICCLWENWKREFYQIYRSRTVRLQTFISSQVPFGFYNNKKPPLGDAAVSMLVKTQRQSTQGQAGKDDDARFVFLKMS